MKEAFGYEGERRYVSFHWSPNHNKLFLCDGFLRIQLSDSTVWPRFLTHPLIAPHLQHVTAKPRRVEAFEFSGRSVPLAPSPLFSSADDAYQMDANVVTNCLLLDRRDAALYVGPWLGALNLHSVVGDELWESGGDIAASGETTGNAEEQMITWLNEHLDDPEQLFTVAAAFHRFSQYQQTLDQRFCGACSFGRRRIFFTSG